MIVVNIGGGGDAHCGVDRHRAVVAAARVQVRGRDQAGRFPPAVDAVAVEGNTNNAAVGLGVGVRTRHVAVVVVRERMPLARVRERCRGGGTTVIRKIRNAGSDVQPGLADTLRAARTWIHAWLGEQSSDKCKYENLKSHTSLKCVPC